jgi:hypothetical protein
VRALCDVAGAVGVGVDGSELRAPAPVKKGRSRRKRHPRSDPRRVARSSGHKDCLELLQVRTRALPSLTRVRCWVVTSAW